MKRVQRCWWAWQRARRWQSKRWVVQMPAYELWRDWRRECDALKEYLDKQRRITEWEALKAWWSCQEREQYAEVRRYWGNDLKRALDKWHKTDKYKKNKARYQR